VTNRARLWHELRTESQAWVPNGTGEQRGCSWGALYRARKRDHGSGRESCGRRWVSLPSVSMPITRGRGTGTVPIYEGNSGGTGDTPAQLQPRAEKRPSAVHDAEKRPSVVRDAEN
jgi:hypothetical protein